MEVNGLHLCIGCMHPLEKDGTCSCCHLVQSSYHSIPRCLPPGTGLANRYILGRVLGEGNFGITYIGWDTLLELPVSVKEYFPSELVSRDAISGTDKRVYIYENEGKEEYRDRLNRFLNEARNLSRFNKMSGIVSVRDFFYENNTAYMVMEYVDGLSVKKYVESKGRMEGGLVLRLMEPVIMALGNVHNTGLIHRDISPDNLLITKEERLVLIDFGSARMRNAEMTRSLTVMFKRGYSPEEQYRSRGKQGEWSDVYALCATMYYMLVGRAPDEAIERILEDETPSLLNMPEISLSKRQKAAIMKGVSIRANERYQNVNELYDALYRNEDEEVKRTAQGTGWAGFGSRRAIYERILGMLLLLILIASTYSIQGYFSQNASSDNAEETNPYAAKPDVEETEAPEPTFRPYVMISMEGLSKEDVERTVANIKDVIINVTWEKEFSNTVKKGLVISQNVSEGTECLPGQSLELKLTLSKGKKKVRVPEVLGLDYKKAIQKLKTKHLRHQVVWRDAALPKGTVMTQSKAAGTKVAVQTMITLEVSNETLIRKKANEVTNTKDDDFDGVIP